LTLRVDDEPRWADELVADPRLLAGAVEAPVERPGVALELVGALAQDLAGLDEVSARSALLRSLSGSNTRTR
jgi:hypothetical protein